MVSSIVWALVALIFFGLVDRRYGQWLKSKQPLADKQLNELKTRLDDLQNQVSRLSINKGFNDE
jgi:uncharacterized membrane-anchored protein YhcB (DUF1043 family)